MLKNASRKAKVICILAAAAIIGIFLFTPIPEGLTFAGWMSLSLLLAGLVLWVGEPVPFAISGFMVLVLLVVFGILPTSGTSGTTVWVGFISSVIFFILASFGLSAALLKTKIPTKIVYALLKLSKGKTNRVILAFMLSSGFVSMFVSDLPCCALFTGIATSSILKIEEAKPGESKLGRAIMIAIPYAAAIGGEVFPSGSSMNIMAMGMLEALTGIHISFLNWGIICAPVAVIMMFTAWVSICIVHKPDPISQKTIDSIASLANQSEKLDVLDKKVLITIGVTFVFWVISNWTGWDATIIALISVIVLFLPGMEVLSWEEYMESVSWNVLLLIGSVQALATGVKEQGAAKWLLGATVGQFAVNVAGLTIATACIVPIIRLFIPVGPALIGIALPPLCALGQEIGITPVFFTVVCGISASTSLMNGLDSTSMLSYRYNYWTIIDYCKSGIIPTIVLMLCHAFMILPIINALGY